MDTVVIVLLVLGVIAIILAAKGKPLWNKWAKFTVKHPEIDIWILVFLILGATIWLMN